MGIYLVTGAGGFIGSNLAEVLYKNGHKVVVADRFSNNYLAQYYASSTGKEFKDRSDKWKNLKNFEYIDIIDPWAALQDHMKYDGVFHLGANANTMEKDIYDMMSKNFEYSKRALEFCNKKKIPLVYASSASVYGNTLNIENNPLNIYAFSKSAFDNHVKNFISENRRRKVIGLRFFNVYGKNEYHKGKMASFLFQKFCEYKRTGQVTIFEDGTQARDFIWVDDVVKALMNSMFNKVPSGIYDIGTGVATQFYEVAKYVLQYFGDEGEPRLIPFPKILEGKYQKFTRADMKYQLFGNAYMNIKHKMQSVLFQYDSDLDDGRFNV